MNIQRAYGLGRRKSSVAKVYLVPGQGNLTIYKKHHGQVINQYHGRDYFPNEMLIMDLEQPLEVAGQKNKFDIEVEVKGGGFSGQAGAIRLGIARALLSINPDWKSELKSKKLTTRDARVKERKKIGKYGARRSPQFTKR